MYSGSDKLKEVGWYNENTINGTMSVGLKIGNELGVFDMSGNVFEWCEDDWHVNYKRAPIDSSAWIDSSHRGARRVIRGGSWLNNRRDCRVSYRHRGGLKDRGGGIGFRLALSHDSVR